MMDPLTLFGLGKIALEAVGGFFDDKKDKTEVVTKLATSAIREVLNLPKEEEISESHVKQIMENQEKLNEFQLKLRDQSILERKNELDYHLQNANAAREMYKVNSSQANKVANQVILGSWVAIGGCLIINGLLYYFLRENVALLLGVGNLIGMIVQASLSERNTVVNFFFGSSADSKPRVSSARSSDTKEGGRPNA